MVLWWRVHISQSKFKDDIDRLNTDDVLGVILKIERENAMEPYFNIKFDVFFNTFYLWVGILKKHAFIRRWHFFLRKSKSEGEIIGNDADTVLNDFYGSGKQKYLNNVWRNISLDSSDDAIVILQNTKKTTCDVPGCVAGANKRQTTYEKLV